ncbi:sialin-like [Anneissia japonica]|uniref:sialin-like n=1 Tax=Anneissia japonica TaxID=1529436 RepID=UPI001425798E|nr:sialin-like [Anneissia japonica]
MSSDSDYLVKLKGQIPGIISCRYLLAFLGCLGFVNVYAMRVNLSVALVAMTKTLNRTNNYTGAVCPAESYNSTKEEGDFDWDEQTQGLILSSFFYGYICTQIPGGWLGGIFGGKHLFGIGVLCTTVFTLLTPLAAQHGVGYLVALRVLEGLGEGVTFPAMHAMWSNWAPPFERSKLLTITYAGSQLGTVISNPLSGWLCSTDFLGGWPSVFYVFGTCGVIWFAAWTLLVHNYPEQHPRISPQEREFIEKSIGKVESKAVKLPILAMAKSLPLWVIAISHFANNYGFYTMLTNLPSYMKNILGFDITRSGYLSAVPYIANWLIIVSGGQIADYLRSHGYLSTTNTRKLFNSLGMMLPALFLVLTGYVGCNKPLAILCLTLAVGCGGFSMSGFNINHLDIAPKYAGVLMGFTNTIATIPGFVGPLIVGTLTENNDTRQQWQIVFWICFGIYALGLLTYLLFGSGVEQEWAKDSYTGTATNPLHIEPLIQAEKAEETLPYPQYSSEGSLRTNGIIPVD